MEKSTPHPEDLAALDNYSLASQTAAALVGGKNFDIAAEVLRKLLEVAEGENPDQTPYVDALYTRLGGGLGYEEPEEVES